MEIKLTPEEIRKVFEGDDCPNPVDDNELEDIVESISPYLEAQLKKLQDLAPDEVVEEIAEMFYEREFKMLQPLKTPNWQGLDDYDRELYLIIAREIAIFKVVEGGVFTLEEIEVLKECFMSQARSIYVHPERSREAPIYKKLALLAGELTREYS